ncbi:MAG: flagellar basal body rod protein FlgC [Acidimicrobiales bacterium]
MSSIWSSIDVAGTGVTVDQTWINSISSNIANMNDGVTPGAPVYRAQYVVAGEQVPGGMPGALGTGVQVQAIDLGPAQGQNAYEPSNPVANAQGEVAYPVVDMNTQLTNLIQAQTSYQANAKVMVDAKIAYQAILNIKA